MVASLKQAFGEPVTYQAAQSGMPAGDPFQVTAIRKCRVHEEAGAGAAFEEISIYPPDFSTAPAVGDWVTAWGTQYKVTAIRQPFAYGLQTLVLQQRAAQVFVND